MTSTPWALGGCSGDASLGADDERLGDEATGGSRREDGASPVFGHSDQAAAGEPSTDIRGSGGVHGVGGEQTAADTSSGGSTNEGGADSTGGVAPTGGTSGIPTPTGGTEGVEPSESTGGQQQAEQQQAGAAGASVEAAGEAGTSSQAGGAGLRTGDSGENTCTLTECAIRRQCVEDCSSEDVTYTCCPCPAGMMDRNACP
ncbi:MAG: hypothetical protein JW940_02890 [Polyangiaceae bacterium]|nr:hypothetical protein [Polyangiaceae bacterium]